MPQNSPSRVGASEVRKACDAVFKTINLTVQFNVAEVAEIAPKWVFARTNSARTVKVHATGAAGPEANQELFRTHDHVQPGISSELSKGLIR